jgi:Ca2+-binding EF-hand superfamily protein
MDQIQFLLRQSPSCESISLEFNEIENLEPFIPYLRKFPNLTSLNLFGNHLQSLPISLSDLKSLKSLDISNNPFPSLDSILDSLKSLPNLESLHITLSNESELSSLPSLLPHLEELNGSSLERGKDYSIKQEELEKIALAYDEIRAIWRVFDEGADKGLADFFDNKIKSIMGELSDIAKARCPPKLLNAHMLKAKFNLNQMCLEKIVTYSKAKTPETQNIFEATLTEMNSLHQATVEMLINTLENNLKLVRNLNERKNAVNVKEVEKFQMIINEKCELLENANREKEELLDEIASLQEENKKYLDTIIKRTKNSAESQKVATVTLSKQEVKELIGFVYNSKSKLEIQQSEPKKTMTQHLFTCLAEKYRSRARSVQKASELVASLKKYLDDVDILLFAKILRSDCDENYRFLHEQVRETITEMVKEHSKTDEIKSKSWMEIVKFVYDQKDAEEMIKFIPLSKRSKPSLNSTEFVNYLLHFQLKSHERYISKFNNLFKVVDKDLDGILTDNEFFKLCQSFELHISNQDVSRFLEIIDPFDSGKVLYSDCVGVFSTELVPGRSNPILQELT